MNYFSIRKMSFAINLDKLKKNELKYWVSFSPYGSGLGTTCTSIAFLFQNFVPNSGIGSVCLRLPRLRASVTESEFTALAFNSRLRGTGTFLILDSKST